MYETNAVLKCAQKPLPIILRFSSRAVFPVHIRYSKEARCTPERRVMRAVQSALSLLSLSAGDEASSPAQATSGVCVCCQREVGIAAKFSGCDVPRSVAREYHNPGAANSTPPLSSLSTRRNSNSMPAIGQRASDICDRGIGGHPVPGLELALPKSELLRPLGDIIHYIAQKIVSRERSNTGQGSV